MKFSVNPFTIDKNYADVLRNKAGIFKSETGTRKAVALTFISTFGLARNQYAGVVQKELTMDALFGR